MNANEIQTIIDAGGTVTPEYSRLEERWNIIYNIDTDLIGRLTEAVLGDAPVDEVADLHALALAVEATTNIHRATVRNAVTKALENKMQTEYAKTAVANYNTIRDAFNQDADAFTAAHQIVPATTDPATLVTAAPKTRNAWAEGQALAIALTAKLPLLVTAATLAGARTAHPTTPIGLALNVDGLHRRRVWEAFEEGWTALLELGATIHAPELEHFQDYREPRPMRTEHVKVGIGWRNVEVDPEDDDYTPNNAKPTFADNL